jgi:hypothetical protein
MLLTEYFARNDKFGLDGVEGDTAGYIYPVAEARRFLAIWESDWPRKRFVPHRCMSLAKEAD